MRTFLLLLLLGSAVPLHAQCDSLGVLVSASDSTYVQLYHPGFFMFGATANVGGFDNVCFWTITDVDGNIIHEAETAGDWENQSFMLFNHDIPVTDTLFVDLVLTSPLEDHDCCISDTLVWVETEVLGEVAFGDWNTEPGGWNFGMACNVSSVNAPPAMDTIHLSPQPATTSLRIEGLLGGESIQVFDATGRECPGVTMDDRGTLDIQHLPSGVYILTVTSENGQGRSQRFLKE